jgi:hypothetical protein
MMNLQRISYALRAAADVARAGENLLVSMDRSRRGGLMPLLVGVALGVGIGALVFQKELRERVLAWASTTVAPSRTAATNGASIEPQATIDAPQV